MEWFEKLKQREPNYLKTIISATFAPVMANEPEEIASITEMMLPILLTSSTLKGAQQAILANYTESQEIAIKESRKVRAEKLADDVAEQLKSSQIMPGSTILDVGCGDGIVAAHLHQKGYQVTCADIDDYRSKEAKTLPFIQINPGRDDYALVNGRWDASLLLYVLHHMPKQEQKILLRQAFDSDIHNLLIYEDVHGNQDYYADIDGISNLFLQTKDMKPFVVPMPCSYQSKQEWENLFDATNLNGGFLKLHRQGNPSSGSIEVNYYFLLNRSPKKIK